MLKPVENAPRRTRLADMGVVRVQGADAITFLQGQVSNDVARLSAGKSVLAGLHNPQGRTIALLRLVLAAPDEILAVVPRELAASVATRLGKFVLRAKAKIADVSSEWAITGITDELAEVAAGETRRDDEGRLRVCLGPSRWLALTRAGQPETTEPSKLLDASEWRALDIAAGLPQVYVATSEAFVAQMLNLDLVDGVAFDKGCYTGQEVIARAHYRGKVKRRMQRFRTRDTARLAAGDSGALSDGRSFKVVDAVQLSDGRCEFLAVTTFGDAVEDASESAPAQDHAIDAEQLALPYSLPA
jgi:folate-binding protein YgfZ